MKINFKKVFTAIAAAVMCAVPMTGAMSANAADRYIIPEKSIKLDLGKADLTRLDTSVIKVQYGTLSVDTRLPIDPDNPSIPRLPEIKIYKFREPDIRDLRKPVLPTPVRPVLQTSQVIEQCAKYTYYDSTNRLITIIVGYTTDGKYIIEYWANYRKLSSSTSLSSLWVGTLLSRTQLNDPAYNTSLVSRTTKTEYYLDNNYRVRKEITGYTKNGNRIVENWRLSTVTGKWELMSRKITAGPVYRLLSEAVIAERLTIAD